MNVIIALLLVDTVVQLIVCHFSLWWFIALICRALFCCRMLGATFKVKKLAIGEGVAFGIMVVWLLLFHSSAIPWLRILFNALFALIAVGLEILDDILYVYVIEDYTE